MEPLPPELGAGGDLRSLLELGHVSTPVTWACSRAANHLANALSVSSPIIAIFSSLPTENSHVLLRLPFVDSGRQDMLQKGLQERHARQVGHLHRVVVAVVLVRVIHLAVLDPMEPTVLPP